MDTMSAEGILRGGNRLDYNSPTTVRVREGKRQVQDGPCVTTKDLLDGMAEPSLSTHQPWWAGRARLAVLAGRRDEAVAAYERTLALTVETALRDWLQLQLAALPDG
jgi:predicted RNA polymerase sigma factor